MLIDWGFPDALCSEFDLRQTQAQTAIRVHRRAGINCRGHLLAGLSALCLPKARPPLGLAFNAGTKPGLQVGHRPALVPSTKSWLDRKSVV